MTDNRPSSESQPTQSVTVSNLVKASRPMTEVQVHEFCARMSRGWKAVPDRTKKASTIVPTSVASQSSSEDEPELADDLYGWIDEKLAVHAYKTPRKFADAAVREFLNVPCTDDELLSFFRAFAQAYQRSLRQYAERPLNSSISFHSSTVDEDNTATSFFMAKTQPEVVAARLSRIEALGQTSPESVELFCLSEFAGCSPQELSRYLGQPEERIFEQIDNRRFDVCVD